VIWRTARRGVLAAAMLQVFILSALAQERRDTEASLSNEWSFLAAPYGWLTALDGSATVKGRSTGVHASISDMVDNLDIAAMGQFEARKGRYGVFVSPVFASLSTSASAGPFRIGPFRVGPVDTDTTVKLFTVDVGTYVTALDFSFSGGLEHGGSRVVAEPYVGARIWYVRGELDVPLRNRTASFSGSETWADAIVGLRTRWDITERWNVSFFGDIGGFVGASEFTGQALAFGGYRFDLFGERDANAIVGYRMLYDDYVSGSDSDRFVFDLMLHGPIAGLSVKF